MNTNLNVCNPHFICFSDDFLTIDILGGVEINHIERMICTLRISHGNYPPLRTTIDLYNDNQFEKLQRTICDKWNLKLLDVSKTLHNLTLQLEEYKIKQLKYASKNPIITAVNDSEKQEAIALLKDKNLLTTITTKLNETGILGENSNAIILFLTLASYKYENPFWLFAWQNRVLAKVIFCKK